MRIATSESIGTTLLGVWVVRQSYLKQNPDNIQRFIRAWEMAMDRFAKDRLSVLKPEAERLGQTPEAMAEIVDRQQAVRPAYDAQLTAQFIGMPGKEQDTRLAAHFKGIAQFLLDLKRINAAPSDWSLILTADPLSTYLKAKK